jgi:hypothetical protein
MRRQNWADGILASICSSEILSVMSLAWEKNEGLEWKMVESVECWMTIIQLGVSTTGTQRREAAARWDSTVPYRTF